MTYDIWHMSCAKKNNFYLSVCPALLVLLISISFFPFLLVFVGFSWFLLVFYWFLSIAVYCRWFPSVSVRFCLFLSVWHQCYYPHTSRDLDSPLCMIVLPNIYWGLNKLTLWGCKRLPSVTPIRFVRYWISPISPKYWTNLKFVHIWVLLKFSFFS